MPPSNNSLQVKLENCLTPPYERVVWNYKRADVTAIRKELDLVNWNQVPVFDWFLMNIFTNYVPKKYESVDDQDPP